jgi:hypothetical protein
MGEQINATPQHAYSRQGCKLQQHKFRLEVRSFFKQEKDRAKKIERESERERKGERERERERERKSVCASLRLCVCASVRVRCD